MLEKSKKEFQSKFSSTLAVLSSLVFVAQMLNFPIVGGTSGHLVGGTFLATIFGPHIAALSMTIVLLIQAIFFADGGITTFGANIFSMAIIGAFSYYLVKLMSGRNPSTKRFLTSVFATSWLSIVLGAFACALEIGFSQAFPAGITATIPAMLFWHVIIGIGEGAITTPLVSAMMQMQPALPAIQFSWRAPIREAKK